MATRSLLTVPLLITVAAAAAAWLVLGPAAALAFVALAFLEIAMAADSSVPMAGIAGRLHSPARRLFLSLGIVAGVLAMRLLLPPAAVAVGDATDPASSVEEAVFAPGSFSAHLAEVRPALAAFGAAFIWRSSPSTCSTPTARPAGRGWAAWRRGSPPSRDRASGHWSPLRRGSS